MKSIIFTPVISIYYSASFTIVTDKGHDLIKRAEDSRIYLPTPQEINMTRVNNIDVSDKVRAEFFEKSRVNRYFLLNESDDLYLTKKQGECAQFYINGQTSKQIARAMSVSPRTNVVSAYEPTINFEFTCRRHKQRALVDVLLNHSQLSIAKLASWLEVSLRELQDVHSGFRYLSREPAQNLAPLFLILFGE